MLESLFNGSNYQAAKALLDVADSRHRILASNLANVETPGYQRRDVNESFRAALESQVRKGAVQTGTAQDMIPVSLDRNAPATRPDGNTVSLDRELAMLRENALEYEVLGQFVSGSLQRLKTAISGKV